MTLPQAGVVVDIGCGGGYNIKRMLSMSGSAKFIGLDISHESVRKAAKVNKNELGKRVKIIKGSAERLPFKAESISLVTAFETVFFWKEISFAFAEIFRCLKLSGSFAVINNYGDPNINWEKKVPCMTRYTAEQIGALMSDTGFSEVTVSKKDKMFLVVGKKADQALPR